MSPTPTARLLSAVLYGLADWEVATLVHRVQEIEAGANAMGSRARAGLHLIEEMNEPFERLLDHGDAETEPRRDIRSDERPVCPRVPSDEIP